MPQIWLTYEELAEMFSCDVGKARQEVIAQEWPRRRCHDGLTRTKLSPATAHEYMLRYAAACGFGQSADEMVAALRGALALMAPAQQVADSVEQLGQHVS